MRVLRHPGHRLLAWAVVLVGVGAAAGLAHAALWQVVVLELLAAGLVVLADRPPAQTRAQSSYLLSYMGAVEADTRVEPPLDVGDPVEGAPVPPEPPARVDREPEDALIDQPVGARPPERGIGRRPAGLLTPTVGHSAEPVPRPRWNLWDLDRLAHQRAEDNEEIAFLLFYLRDFADPEGLLPTDFEPLIREAFGSLLASAVA